MITNESNMAKDDSLRVGGATLFYRVRGSGPLLLILPGGDGDADTPMPFATNSSIGIPS
jgi:hypothetical protein